MGVLLQICCIFSEYSFQGTPLGGSASGEQQHVTKSFTVCSTQLPGDVLLKTLKYIEATLKFFEFSCKWEMYCLNWLMQVSFHESPFLFFGWDNTLFFVRPNFIITVRLKLVKK